MTSSLFCVILLSKENDRWTFYMDIGSWAKCLAGQKNPWQTRPVPGGWDVTVETYDAETRIIPLNVNKETGEANRFILKMIEEYKKEGLTMEMEEKWYESYGTYLRDLKVTGHPILINAFEDFIENMR